MNLLHWLVSLALALPFLASCAAEISPVADAADLVLHNATVHTMDPGQSSAQAIAVVGERIVALGSDQEVAAWINEQTQVLDLDGAVVIPGLIENHGHFLSLGETLTQVDLTGADSFEEIVERVGIAADAAEPGAWIRGFGWHQEKWAQRPQDSVAGFPVHQLLSARTPRNPVLLYHASGHAALVNAAAMELSEITAATIAPEGGEIILGAGGHPTGLLNEAAKQLVTSRMAYEEQLDEQMIRQFAVAAAQQALAHGVTTFVDAGTNLNSLADLAKISADGSLGVRLWAMIRDSNERLRDADLPSSNPWFHVGGIKVSLDGALGSRGAWLLEAYSDAPGEFGLQQVELAELQQTAEIALERELQLAVHAIGDRANHELLNLYQEVLDEGQGDRRWRVEHAQHLHPDDIGRFAQLNVIASMQAVHCTSDGPWVPQRLGAQRSEQGAYVWRALIDSGAIVVNGTDVPVEPIDTFPNLEASVTRKMVNGDLFYPKQSMTAYEALASYTRDGAYAIKAEGSLGTIGIGKLADLVVLNQDPLTVDADLLDQTEVLKTLVGGTVVYQRDNRSSAASAP